MNLPASAAPAPIVEQASELRTPTPADLLDAVSSGRLLIQDFVPLAESLDWELGQLYWDDRGGRSFSSREVPFTVNNDGGLSAKAAQVVFQSLLESERTSFLEPRIRVLELGVGAGLFAKYFLDAFARLCRDNAKDYYDRLVYIAADRSERMLQDLEAHNLLSVHAGHYEIALLDATRLRAADIRQHTPGIRAVFLNYVLDSLPAAMLEIDSGETRQLYLRTCLARSANLKDHTRLDASSILECAADPLSRRQLIDLFHLFSIEGEFRPVAAPGLPRLEFAVQFSQRSNPPLRHVLHNYGAMECLDTLLDCLHPHGVILVNDYGLALPTDAGETYMHQHFGASTAIGLNFPLLKSYFTDRGASYWVEPDGDSPRIYSRMLCRSAGEETRRVFRNRFSRAAYDWANQPLDAARTHLKEGRLEAALCAYRDAVSRQPGNWVLLTEVARFVSAALHEHEPGLDLVRRALALNPASGETWNTLGDVLICLERVPEAEQAFLEALRLNPRDAGARYGLVHILMRKNEPDAALHTIADALAHDKTGEYRDRLLQRQSEILARGDQVRQQRGQMLADRFSGIVRRAAVDAP